jgi:predicted small lipoprotein YifL
MEERRMKRLFLLMLVVAMIAVFALAGCGKPAPAQSEAPAKSQVT